jgi:molybdate transport system ATP-binding protein
MNWQVHIRMGLEGLDLDVTFGGANTPLAIIGPNGSGKTTILRTIAGAYEPDAGKIQIGDQLLFDSTEQYSLPPEERQVGYVPQGFGLFPHLTVLDNVGFGWPKAKAAPTKLERRQAATELLSEMGCLSLAMRNPKSLSGGEAQRVALARALMIQPRMLLLDEPLSALDASARRKVRSYLADHLRERAGPTIIVTHDMRDVLALQAQVVAIENGTILQQGTAEELKAQPGSDFVAEFFDTAP